MEACIVYRSYTGVTEKKMEAIIWWDNVKENEKVSESFLRIWGMIHDSKRYALPVDILEGTQKTCELTPEHKIP